MVLTILLKVVKKWTAASFRFGSRDSLSRAAGAP